MYSYEEVYKSTLEYFSGDTLATEVWINKYCLKRYVNNKFLYLELNPDDMHKRLAKEFARMEKKKFGSGGAILDENKIYEYLKNFRYIIPQGSPMFGIGNNESIVSLSNCFVVSSPDDSYGGIMATDEELVQISKRRGGVGIDLSKIRPKGFRVNNSSLVSTGVVLFMKRYSNSIREVGQEGRRGALMLTISVHHPDILDFIKSKADTTQITGANISVKLTNEFLEAVKKDEEYELRFPVDSPNPVFRKKIKARDVWNEIIYYNWLSAEPGVLFFDNILKYDLAHVYKDYGFETVSTNPCSEIPLCEYDSCRLMVVNLFSFVVNPFDKDAYFDFEKFKDVVYVAQRLSDHLVDLEIEKIDQIIKKIETDRESDFIKYREHNLWLKIMQKAKLGRRTGLGMTGWGDTLAALNIKYDSEESIKVAEEIMKVFNVQAFKSSVDMAKELGPFPIFNWELEKNNPFLLNLREQSPELYEEMSKYGRRNISLTTIAPTGSVSILTQTTSGIEPVFLLKYKRRVKIVGDGEYTYKDQLGDKWLEYDVFHPKLKIWMEKNPGKDIKESPYVVASELDPYFRVKFQATVQKYITHAISSTINLSENTTVEDVSKIFLYALDSELKGITIYREGSRMGVLVSPDSDSRNKTNVISKRPEKTKAEIFKNTKYTIVVGIVNNLPYETFIIFSDSVPEDFDPDYIIKSNKNYYLVSKNGKDRIRLSGKGIPSEHRAICRLVSLLLRNKIPVIDIIRQLEKIEDSSLFSFVRYLHRALKGYVDDGVQEDGECPICGSENLVREEGCIKCLSCGYSKCF